jgi:TonB family protein
LIFCLAQSLLAHCSHDSSAGKEDQRIVIVQAKLKRSGAVRDAKVLSGPATLRPAAISAVSQRKYKLMRGSAHLRTITVAVTFAPDSNTVTEMSQMVYVTSPANSVVDMKQVVRAGSPGCVLAPTRVRVSQEVMQTRLLSRVDPVYPPEAQARRIEGTVVLSLLIDEKGNVSKAEKVSGPDMLVRAASEAVRQWKYQPYLLNEMPIEVDTIVDVKFAM